MIDILKPLIKQFMPFAQKQMGFNRPPKLFLRQDEQNAADPLGKTGFYDPQKESITIFTAGRHPKDVMRSLAHELMHHAQNCKGEFNNTENVGEQGYAQSNLHLRSMEIQAYQASIVFRDWEDSIKGTIYNESLQKGANENMSTKNWKNKEINSLLTERWGFKMDLGALNEGKKPEEEKPEEEDLYGSGVGKTAANPETMKRSGEKETRGTATSKRGIPSAAGSVTHPKAGRIDRTDIANKAPAEWIKEGDEDEGKKCRAACMETHREAMLSLPATGGHTVATDKRKATAEELATTLKRCKNDCTGGGIGEKIKGLVGLEEGDKMRPFEPHEEALFEEATTTCNQRHQIQGDKAVRRCIEEEMTRMVNEGWGAKAKERSEEGWGPEAGAEKQSPSALNWVNECIAEAHREDPTGARNAYMIRDHCLKQWKKTPQHSAEPIKEKNLYEMCPGTEEGEGMELEFSPEGPEDVEISGLGAGDDGVEGAFERVQAALLDLAELAGLDLTGGDEEEVINVQESFDEEQIERLADHVYKIYKENLKR